MGLYDEITEVARKSMTLFFIIDVSGSMQGEKIGAVNSTMEELLPELQEISDDNAEAKLKIAVLSFSNDAEWMTETPMDAENASWTDLKAEGITELGLACKELNAKLSKTNGFMGDANGCYAPVLFLMSDGQPTDDYKKGIELLQENPWFVHATKVALAIGSETNKDVLAEFTGTSEAVIETNNVASLKKWIRMLSVTSSQIASRSSNVSAVTPGGTEEDTHSKQTELIEEIQNEILQDSIDGTLDDELEF